MAQHVLELKGGDKLKKVLADHIAKLGGPQAVRVGFLEHAYYTAELGKEPMPVAQAAFYNEFGTSKSPPRPFMRNMIAKSSPKWGEELGAVAKAADYNGAITMQRMGQRIQGQTQKSINEFTSPPLAPATVARKGFAKPLIDTATMIKHVDYDVVEGAEHGP